MLEKYEIMSALNNGIRICVIIPTHRKREGDRNICTGLQIFNVQFILLNFTDIYMATVFRYTGTRTRHTVSTVLKIRSAQFTIILCYFFLTKGLIVFNVFQYNYRVYYGLHTVYRISLVVLIDLKRYNSEKLSKQRQTQHIPENNDLK